MYVYTHSVLQCVLHAPTVFSVKITLIVTAARWPTAIWPYTHIRHTYTCALSNAWARARGEKSLQNHYTYCLTGFNTVTLQKYYDHGFISSWTWRLSVDPLPPVRVYNCETPCLELHFHRGCVNKRGALNIGDENSGYIPDAEMYPRNASCHTWLTLELNLLFLFQFGWDNLSSREIICPQEVRICVYNSTCKWHHYYEIQIVPKRARPSGELQTSIYGRSIYVIHTYMYIYNDKDQYSFSYYLWGYTRTCKLNFEDF